MDTDELGRKVQYLIDLEEIKKLQRKYQYWLFKQDYEKTKTRPDTKNLISHTDSTSTIMQMALIGDTMKNHVPN